MAAAMLQGVAGLCLLQFTTAVSLPLQPQLGVVWSPLPAAAEEAGTITDRELNIDQDLYLPGAAATEVASMRNNRGQGFTVGLPGLLKKIELLLCIAESGPKGAELELNIVDMDTDKVVATSNRTITRIKQEECPKASQSLQFDLWPAVNVSVGKHLGMALRWDHRNASKMDPCITSQDIYTNCLYRNDALPCYENKEIAAQKCILQPEVYWVQRGSGFKYSGGGHTSTNSQKLPQGGVTWATWPPIGYGSEESRLGANAFRTYIEIDLKRYKGGKYVVPRPPMFGPDGEPLSDAVDNKCGVNVTGTEHSGRPPWVISEENAAAAAALVSNTSDTSVEKKK